MIGLEIYMRASEVVRDLTVNQEEQVLDLNGVESGAPAAGTQGSQHYVRPVRPSSGPAIRREAPHA